MVFSRVRLIDWICARESQLAVTISRNNGNRSSSMERTSVRREWYNDRETRNPKDTLISRLIG